MKSKIRVANTLVKSEREDGLHEGVITSAGIEQIMMTKKVGRDVDQQAVPCFVLNLEFQGTSAPINIRVNSGLTLNPEPLKTLYAGRGKKNEVPVYNKFTTLMLKLGLLKQEELDDLSDDLDLEGQFESLIGQVILSKLGKNDKGFWDVDIQSLKLKG